MKRVFLCILALSLTFSAWPQASVFVSLSGGIKLLDQDGTSGFYQDGAGYDVLTLKAMSEKGNYGFSITDQNVFNKLTYIKTVNGVDNDTDSQYDEIVTTTGTTYTLDIRDWNVWYRILDDRVRISAGILYNYDYRTTLPNWYVTTYGGTDMIAAQGVLTQVYPLPGLSLGLFLPVATSGQSAKTTLGSADAGVSYSIRNVGIAKAFLRMNQSYRVDLNGDGDVSDDGETVTDAYMLNAGFTFTGIDRLIASVLGRFLWSRTADAAFWYAAVGGDYNITPKWAIRGEFGWARKPEFSGVRDAPALGTFWDFWTRVRYRITDRLYTHATFTYDEEGSACVTGALGYSFGDGLGVSTHIGYDGDMLFDLYVYYAVAF